MAIHTYRGSGIENGKMRDGEWVSSNTTRKRPCTVHTVPERATKGKWHACECTAHPSKNIHSFDTLLRRTYPQIQTIFLVLFSIFRERAFEHFKFFLSHRDKMFLRPQATLHLIVRQPASTFEWLDFTAVSIHYNSVRKQTNEFLLACVRVWYVNHPQSSKLENMLSIH